MSQLAAIDACVALERAPLGFAILRLLAGFVQRARVLFAPARRPLGPQ